MNKLLFCLLIFTRTLTASAQVVTISQTDLGAGWYSGNDMLGGQSFVITQAGVITGFNIYTYTPEGLTTFEIREGQDVSGPLLYSTVIDVNASGWFYFPVPNIPVCEGTYCYTQSGWQWGASNTSNPYAAGNQYYVGSWNPFDQAFEVIQVINEQPELIGLPISVSVCAGQTITPLITNVMDEIPGSVVVTATSSNPAIIPSGNITVSGGSTKTISFSAPPTTAGTTTINLTASDGNCTALFSFNVIVNPLPTVDAGIAQTFCAGTSTTLSGSGASFYSWNNGVIDGSSFIPPGTTTYTVTGTDGNGCQNTDNVTITVNPLPIVNFTAVPDQCISGAPIPLTQGSPAGGTYSGTGISGGFFDPSVAGIGTHTANYSYTDGNGCINSANQTITVSGLPLVNFPALADICENAAPLVLNVATPAGGTYSGTGVSGSTFNPALAGPGTHTLTYNFIDGITTCSNTAGSIITVLAPPTVNAGSPQNVCDGNSVTLSGSGTAVSYAWDNSVSDGVSFIPPVGITTYTVTGTGANTCQNTGSVNITAFALPVVSLTALPDFCIDDAIYGLAEGTPVGGTYSGPGISGTNFDPAAAGVGTHLGQYTYTDGNGCTATATHSIIVNGLPVVTFSPVSDLCLNAVPLSLNSGSPAGGNYSGIAVSGGTFDPSAAGLGTHPLTYDYTDGNGCTNNSSQNVTVYDLPAVTALASDADLCLGESITLNGGGAATYVWDNGATDNIAFTPAAGTTIFTVTGTDVNGCENTDQVSVTVHTPPTVTAGTDQVICEGVSITLNGGGAATYNWDNGATNGVAFLPPVGTTTYTVTGTDVNGCENTDAVIIAVNALPILNTNGDQFFCEGETVILTASGATTYDWNSGAGNTADFSISPVSTTTVQITGTTNGCSATENITLTLDDPSQVSAGTDALVCLGFITYLEATGGVSYTWNGPGVFNETNPNYGFIVDTTAYYFLTAVTAEGCTYTDSVLITGNTGSSCNIEPLTSFSPNGDAVNESWKIQGIESFPENHVTILNRWGDVVFDELNYDNETVLWTGTTQTGSEAHAGTYYFIIEITNGPSNTGWIQLLK